MNRIILLFVMILVSAGLSAAAEPNTNFKKEVIPPTASDPIMDELFALYQRSKDLQQLKSEEDYKVIFSQAMVDKLNRTIHQLNLGSFKDYLDRTASFEIDMNNWKLVPQYIEQNQDKAVLIILCPQAAGWESPGGIGVTEDTVIRVSFIKEDSHWKIDGKEELAVKPSWMGIKVFMLSQEPTNFSDFSQWNADYTDISREDERPVPDIVQLSLSHDDEFLYARVVYVNPPKTTDLELLIYFDMDQDSSTGSKTRDNSGPVILGWERRLELKPSVLNDPQYPFAFEVVPGEWGAQRTVVYFEQKNNWVRVKDNELFLKIPRELLGISTQQRIHFSVVGCWSVAKSTVRENLRGSYDYTQ